jgi:hypothetical protein
VAPPREKVALKPPQEIGPAIEPAKPAAPAAELMNPGNGNEPAAQALSAAEPVAPPKQDDPDRAREESMIPGPTGRIVGTVTYEGLPVPTPTVVTNDKDTECCGVKIKIQDIVISAENRGIMNTIVWIEDVKLPDGYKPPQQSLRLATQKCQFRPHVAAMTLGSSIEVSNADPIAHTVQLTGAQDETIRLKNRDEEYTSEARHAGMIRVTCEDHEWMTAFVRVDPHPFHDVTDADGRFVIAGVPVGEYKLKVWHEKFSEQEIAVPVRAGETTSLKVHYPPGRTPANRKEALRSPSARSAAKK